MRTLASILLLTVVLTACTVVPGQRFRFDNYGLRTEQLDVDGTKLVTLDYVLEPIDASVVRRRKDSLRDEFVRKVQLLPYSADDHASPTDYVLGSGDIVRIDVWDFPQLSHLSDVGIGQGRSVSKVIDADGEIYFPYVGTLKLAGMTPAMAREAVTQRLSSTLVDPQVDVTVQEFRSQWVTVLGEVATPGRYPISTTRSKLVEFVNAAGGLKTSAVAGLVLLLRDGTTYQVPVDAAISTAEMSAKAQQLEVKEGDVIYIPSAADNQAFVLGAVRQQRGVPIQSTYGVSLQRVLSSVSGLNQNQADSGEVYIASAWPSPLNSKLPELPSGSIESAAGNGSGIPPYTIYKINVGTPQGLLLAQQFPVLGGDVVYVGATKVSNFNAIVAQLLPSTTAVFRFDRVVNRFENE